MLSISQKINSLIKTIVYNTTKSRRTTTPRPFSYPQLTPRGIQGKPPRSYNYNLPQNLPNRHLYWNRTERNRVLRKRYNRARLQKLKINPIHDETGKKLNNRNQTQIAAQLSSLRVIRGSVNRTFQNIWEAIQRFPQIFLQKGQHADVLQYAFKQVHDRYLPSLSFQKFSRYCFMRYLAKLPPTQSLMLHFFRFLQACKQNHKPQIKIQRLSFMTNYIFSKSYPQCEHLMKQKKINFELFKQGQQKFITFQDIIPKLYSVQYMKQIKSRINDKNIQKSLKNIAKLPGGLKLIQAIQNA